MIPQGYKQTEIGVIPQDWNVHTLEMLYNITSSKRVFQSQWRKSGIPFYRAREIAVMSEGKSAPEDLYIDADLYNQYTRQYGSIKKDDVLITGVGTLGKVYVVKESDKFYFKDGNIIWLQFKDGFSSQYLKHQYDMPVLINQVFGNAGGSTVATYTITNAKSTKVPVPPLDEQKRIAEALSDVDSMIFSLEKLIAKKKAVKQGAMQELLTGKKRLPGFTGEWYYTTIGEHCYVFDGTHQTPKYTASGIPFYSVENVTSNDFSNTKFISEEEHELLTTKQRIEKGDILMTRIGSIGDCKYVNWDVNASFYVSLALIKCKDTINSQFLSYYSNSTYFKKEIEIRSLLTAIPQKINLGPISEIRLNIPSDIKEQQAIASILSDMDNEIEALEQKLDKTRQIKQGMMQQLLTGKIRRV